MAHAELCPVCKGSGVYNSQYEGKIKCHGCDSKGWVSVGVEYPPTVHGSGGSCIDDIDKILLCQNDTQEIAPTGYSNKDLGV